MNGFDTFNGLPLHVLVIHVVVAGIPLAALVTVAIAVRPRWARRTAWWVLALDLLVYGSALVAKESGERFFTRLNGPQAALAHTKLGETLPWYALGLAGAGLLLVLVHRIIGNRRERHAPGWLAALSALVVLVAAGLAVVQVVRTGDSGARAVWGQTVTSTNHH